MYPLTLPCPQLSTGTSKLNPAYNVTEFDYGTRSRNISPGPYLLSWSSVYNAIELQDFRNWYATINYGVDYFEANWSYEGTSGPEQWRYTIPYTVQALSNDNYLISSQVQVQVHLSVECSLLCSDSLLVSDSLILCKDPNILLTNFNNQGA